MVNSNLRGAQKEAEQAEAIVAEEVERMMARLKVAEVTPTIVRLQEQLEQIRATEVEKAQRKLRSADAGAGGGRGSADARYHQ